MALMDRVMGAVRLNTDTYEDLERDTEATSQALTVVIAVAIANGVGAFIGASMAGRAGAGVIALILGVVGALIGWFVGSYIIYWVGTSLFGGTGTWGEVLRTLGFAYAPSALGIFSFIPVLGGLLALVGGIWTIIAEVIAIRQSLDITTGKAIATGIIGAIAYAIIWGIVAAIVGGIVFAGAAATGAFR